MAGPANTRSAQAAAVSPPRTQAGHGRERAAFAPTLALTATLALGCFVVVLALVELLSHPSGVPPTKQHAESALYLIGFGAILPLALVAGPRLADAIAATPSGAALSSLAAVLGGSLAGVILLVRVLPGAGNAQALAGAGAWLAGAACLLVAARRPRGWPALARLAPIESTLWLLTGGLVLAALLAFTSIDSIDPLALAVGLAAMAAILLLYGRAGGWRPRVPGRRSGLAIDAVAIVALLLAVPDVVIFSKASAKDAFAAYVGALHQDFVLGPANVVVHGGTLLVDAASQYGVGSVYLVAGWSGLTRIGYGTFGLLDAVLFALLYAGAYCVLRLAGTRRAIAIPALAVGVVVLVYNLVFPVGTLPAQHGPLRFGLPLLLVLAATAEARWPRRSTAALLVQLVVVGLSSIWSFEDLLYTLGTFAALTALRAYSAPLGSRAAFLLRRAGAALAACLAAQLVLVVGTLDRAGELPDYGWYLAYLRSFLFGRVGEITYDFPRWSAGLPVAAGYGLSAAALVLLLRRRRGVLESDGTTVVALCGTTAYGLALFSYFDNRSAAHVLPYVSLPLLLAGALWLSLVLRRTGSRAIRMGALGFALALSALLVSVAWSSLDQRVGRTALAHVIPGGQGLHPALRRLWRSPPINRRAPEGDRLVARYLGGNPLLVMKPDLETEILLRTDRVNRLALDFEPEDSFVRDHYLPGLRSSVASLRAGTPLLIDLTAAKAFRSYRAHSERDPFHDPIAPSKLAPLQEWALRALARRFDLHVVHRDNQGFIVAVLSARR
jgi:hypothetical protein